MPTPYIPGVSSQIFKGQLMPEVRKAEGGLYEGARGLESAQSKRAVTGALGAMGGRAVGKAVQKYLLASGHPLLAFLAPHIGAGIGTYLGTKAAGRGPKIENPTGLLDSEYDVLRDIRRRMPDAAKGAAWGRFGSSLGWDLLSGGMKSESGKELFGDLFKQSEDPYSDIKEMADEAFGPERSELSQSVAGKELFGVEGSLSEAEKTLESSDWFRELSEPEQSKLIKQRAMGFEQNPSLVGDSSSDLSSLFGAYRDPDKQSIQDFLSRLFNKPDNQFDSDFSSEFNEFPSGFNEYEGTDVPKFAGGGPVGGLIQYRKGY
jgi:hypothetical protein